MRCLPMDNKIYGFKTTDAEMVTLFWMFAVILAAILDFWSRLGVNILYEVIIVLPHLFHVMENK